MPGPALPLPPELGGCYYAPMQRRAGFVLTGGKSSRMGRNKALLSWHGRSLVEHVAEQVQKAAGTIHLIGNPEEYQALNIPCVADRWVEGGPLGGIYTALSLRQAPWNLVAACDLPTIQSPWLNRLLEIAEASRAQAVFLREKSGKPQPLCAAYHSSCLDPVHHALQTGELALMRLIPKLDPIFVDCDVEVVNVNSPADWEALVHA